MHFYEGYHFWGMHLIWWIAWIAIIGWFLISINRNSTLVRKGSSPLEILQKKYASGVMTTAEYEERKAILKRDGAK